ncbi:hypothetical protein HF086_004705 [Spodoptera exigua]|uniref:PAS domain-containing serine/threonine-protein kinase n=1 Tax=Spodoptera exigua TaxID=7107 RepID=A0A922M7F6_SPOEX|nr:hypothetical protein HF086_004705 [Spodoptera exigua]
MESTGLINYNRNSVADSSSLTPVKPRLGRFVDVYSPEHLNITPRPKPKLKFTEARDESPNFVTPEKYIEVDFKCRTAKAQDRHRNVFSNCSFEGNQSFPRLSRKVRPMIMELETPTKVKQAVDLVRVDGPNGLRFNTSLAPDVAGSPAPSQTERLQQTINPSKAVFTIEPNTLKILIVNNKACSLLGYSSGDLCGLRFSDLLRNRNCKAFSLHEPEDCDASEDGTVVELISKDGGSVQVSLWIRQLDNDGPCLVVAEPVNCKNVVLTVEADTGRTLDGGCFPLCLWISKPDVTDNSLWPTVCGVKTHRPVFEVNVRVTYNVSGLLVVDESGIITACNHHFAMLTFGKPHSEVIGHHIEDVIQNFCQEADIVKIPERNRNMTLSPVNNEDNGSASDTDEDSCGAFNGSQKSACMSLNVHPSILSTTREKSSSALCLDKSCSMVTHTPTPTQDMVSSISTTEQRNDISALPDVTSGMSGISIDDENYCHSSISKSRSENILRSEQSNPTRPVAKPSEKSDSIYYTSQHSQEVTPTGTTPRVRLNDPSLRLSFDSSKYRSLKANLPGKDDKTSLSLDFCDSNETSADFLTPINEMPPPGCEIEDLPKHNGNESVDSLSNENDLETQTESAPRKLYSDDAPETPCVAKRMVRTLVMTSTPQHARNKPDCEAGPDTARDGTYRGVVLHKDGTQLNVLYTVSSMQLGGAGVVGGAGGAGSGPRVRCVWLGVQLEDARRHTTLASSVASTADNSLILVRKGAYGCVKMAYRRSDRLLTVAKFILKEKVGAQFWVDAPDGRRVPLELSLLLTLKHPNIIGQAVEYLHSLNILHRDIKDENVIIDNKFHVKLIDFGSATFMSKDTLFSTFYGTTEYCSPEVLAGNKYAGPELEMWSMGITLYVLTFFVNPFSDIEDTIQGPLAFPQVVSEDLEQLLRWMLCKEPASRCTISQLMAHPWIRQPVVIANYVFHEIVDCERSNPSEVAIRSDGKNLSRDEPKRNSLALHALSTADRDAQSDNYSLRSSADILDISSKPVSEAALTDISSDATGHAACDIDYDCDQYECDSWDECEQDSFS